MPRLDAAITEALARLGLDEAKERGWHPRSDHVKRALEALGRDDIDRAIEELGLAWQEEPGGDAAVVREVIESRLGAEEERIDAREAEAKKLRDTGLGEINVLDARLRRLRFKYSPQQMWVALGTGGAVIGSSLVSVARFGLHVAVAAGGFVVFAAAAVLLVAVDRRRQRAAHEAYRAWIGAEVAQEVQILRGQVRTREAEILAARTDRDRLSTRRAHLPASPGDPSGRSHLQR